MTANDNRPTEDDRKQLAETLRRANAGDEEARLRLQKFVAENPCVWQQLGDLANVVAENWIRLLTEDDQLGIEATKTFLADLKTNLSGDDPSPIEKLLIDTVAATWLEVRYLESINANENTSVKTTKSLMTRLESAQRRHLNSIRQLAQIRKLLPVVSAAPELKILKIEEVA